MTIHHGEKSLSSGGDGIEHVVLLIMEDHSFDQMLGALDAVHGSLDGVSNAARFTNDDGEGNTFFLAPITEKQIELDPKHDHADVMLQISDGNSGFLKSFVRAHPDSDVADRQKAISYYPLDYLPASHTLGRHFTVCDQWFSSLPGPTWPNRFFMLSGTSSGKVDMPHGADQWTHWLSSQNQDTLFDRMNEKGKSWMVYYHDFPNSLVLRHQQQDENLMRYEHIEKFHEAAAGSEAEFPAFVLIEPAYYGSGQNDDHPPNNVMKAQKLIADIYNGIRANEQLWEKTLLVVVYDEHGGFYDHVPPPSGAVPPDEFTDDFSFTQLGPRVGALLVSPWCQPGVEHTRFDHTSLLAYLRQKWDLGPLGKRAEDANSIGVAITGERRVTSETPAFIDVPDSLLSSEKPYLDTEVTTRGARILHGFADLLHRGIVQLDQEGDELGEWLVRGASADARADGEVEGDVDRAVRWLEGGGEPAGEDTDQQRADRARRTSSVVDEIQEHIARKRRPPEA